MQVMFTSTICSKSCIDKKGLSILIVDSDQTFRGSAINHLLFCGFEKIEEADSIDKALEKCSQNLFNIILVDLFVPQMSGLQFANKILKQQVKAKIILMVDDQYQHILNGNGKVNYGFPTILKSLEFKRFVTQDLQRFLLEN